MTADFVDREVVPFATAWDRTETMDRAIVGKLAALGAFGMTIPEEYGGLGENHVAFTMVCETLARYGCASTAMCYVMHMAAVATIMLRPMWLRPSSRPQRFTATTYTPFS